MNIILLFFEPFFHSLSNILDNVIIRYKSLWIIPFMIYSSIFSILIIPVSILFWWFPQFPNLYEWIWIIIISLASVLYLPFYYKALECDNNTSRVISYFKIWKIFLPFISFFFLWESLWINVYLWFILIIWVSLILWYEKTDWKFFKLWKSFYLMLLASIILLFEVTAYKYLFLNWSNFITIYLPAAILTFIFSIIPVVIPKYYYEIKESFWFFKEKYYLFLLQSLFLILWEIWMALSMEYYSVLTVKWFSSLQPIIILVLAIIFWKRFPLYFSEETDKWNIKKFILYWILIFWCILLLI